MLSDFLCLYVVLVFINECQAKRERLRGISEGGYIPLGAAGRGMAALDPFMGQSFPPLFSFFFSSISWLLKAEF